MNVPLPQGSWPANHPSVYYTRGEGRGGVVTSPVHPSAQCICPPAPDTPSVGDAVRPYRAAPPPPPPSIPSGGALRALAAGVVAPGSHPMDPRPASPGQFTVPENWRQMTPDAAAWSRRCLRCNFYCPPCNTCLDEANLCAADVQAGRVSPAEVWLNAGGGEHPNHLEEPTQPAPPPPGHPPAERRNVQATRQAGPGQFTVPDNWRQMPPDAAAWARRCLRCTFYSPPCNDCLEDADRCAEDCRAGRVPTNPNSRMRRGWIAEEDSHCPPPAHGRLKRGWVAEDPGLD